MRASGTDRPVRVLTDRAAVGRVGRYAEPYFSWTVDTGDPNRGRVRVRVRRGWRVSAVAEALRATHGVRGEVRECRLSLLGLRYIYTDVVAIAELDSETGAVVWAERDR